MNGIKLSKITLGHTYQEKYLSKEATKRNTRVTKVTKKPYGYLIKMMNDYITLFTVKLEIYEDGFAKARIKIEKNYQPTRMVSRYFDQSGREIISETNNQRVELNHWKRLRNEIQS